MGALKVLVTVLLCNEMGYWSESLITHHHHFMLVTSGPVVQNCCITTALDTLCVRCGCHTNCKDLFNLYWSLCCLFAGKTGKTTGKLQSEICMNWLNKISLVLYVCMICISCLLHVINWTVFSLRGGGKSGVQMHWFRKNKLIVK